MFLLSRPIVRLAPRCASILLASILAVACGSVPAEEVTATGSEPSALVSNAPYSPAPADFDHDGHADMSLRTPDGVWHIDYASNGFHGWDLERAGYGGLEGTPCPADYDGDGRADLALKDSWGTWFIDFASNDFGGWDISFPGYGNASAKPVCADYDGDGRADLAIKSDDGGWFIDLSSEGDPRRYGFGGWNLMFYGYGDATVTPAPADYDGDGRADLAIKTARNEWYIDYSSIGDPRTRGFGAWDEGLGGYGVRSSIAAPGDYDHDGFADIATLGSDGVWRIDFHAGNYKGYDVEIPHHAGTSRFLPVPAPADYDGDGQTDLAAMDRMGFWTVDVAPTVSSKREAFVNAKTPTATCGQFTPTCSLAHYYGDRSAYYDNVLAKNAPLRTFTCSAPGVFNTSTSDDGATWLWLYYAVCTDTPGLREIVREDDGSAKLQGAMIRRNTCNTCLPRAPAGHVYVVWTDPAPTTPVGGGPARCQTACMMPAGM